MIFFNNLIDGCYGVFSDKELYLRCFISCLIALALYLIDGSIVHYFFKRNLTSKTRPKVFSFNWNSDVMLAIISLLSGTPVLQFFILAAEKYGSNSGMTLYKYPSEYAIWGMFLQIPIYLILWDLVFYILHRWILHTRLGYKLSHTNHHAFRPPTGKNIKNFFLIIFFFFFSNRLVWYCN